MKTQRGDGGDGANLHPVRTLPLPPPREWVTIAWGVGVEAFWGAKKPNTAAGVLCNGDGHLPEKPEVTVIFRKKCVVC